MLLLLRSSSFAIDHHPYEHISRHSSQLLRLEQRADFVSSRCLASPPFFDTLQWPGDVETREAEVDEVEEEEELVEAGEDLIGLSYEQIHPGLLSS